MNEIIYIILTLFSGIVIGVFFYGGLWFTVQKVVKSKVPAFWVVSSFILRIGSSLIGFYYISFGQWQRVAICLAGFIVARYIVIRFTATNRGNQMKFKKEAQYED